MSKWNNNRVQFARLICEINATVHISNTDWHDLCDGMDISSNELNELFDRAHKEWEQVKKADVYHAMRNCPCEPGNDWAECSTHGIVARGGTEVEQWRAVIEREGGVKLNEPD